MSIVTITFRTSRDIEVAIDSIEGLSPRSMDMAWLMLEKKYLSMKGANVHSMRAAKKANEELKAANEATALRLSQLYEEEQAKNREQALAAASDRLQAETAGSTSSSIDEPKNKKVSKK